MKKTSILFFLVLLIFGPTAWAQWTGNGTEADPYLINSESDWTQLCTNVNNGTNHYNGKYFKLTADISVSETFSGEATMQVGRDNGNEFWGIFDGNGHTLTVNYTDNSSNNYCGPFRVIENATIKNLHVAGSIYKKDKKHAAGIVGKAYGTVHITNCRSSVDILVHTNGDGSSGGIVGDVRDSNEVDDIYLTNVLFDGKLRTDNSTTKWGGLIGWVAEIPDAYFENCLFAPQEVSSSIISNSDSRTIARGDGDRHINNCYYKTLIANQAQGATNASSYTNEQLLSALGSGWEIITEGGVEKVLPIIEPRSFTGEGTETNPYQINNESDWNLLCTNVNNHINNYNGKFFKLMADISVSETFSGEATKQVGRDDGNEFWGTFDGNGHTLTVNYTDNSSNNYCGPFRVIENATIKNLHVAGSIYKKDKKHAAGIVGKAYGTVHITNCRSSVDILVHTNGDGSSGGIVGDVRDSDETDDIYLTNVLFDGKLRTDNSTTKWGGLIGWVADIPDAYFENCLFAPQEVSSSILSNSDSKTFARGDGDRHFTNCYYKTLIANDAQGSTNASNYSNEYLRMVLGDGWEVFAENGVEKVLPIIGPRTLTGQGSVASPYLIANALDWHALATNVYLGQTYSGKYFKLTNDISISRMIGLDNARSFRGTFDGNSHTLTFNYTATASRTAPFRYVQSATIKNLHVDGTIESDYWDYSAGIVGRAYRATLTNCRSSIIIRSSIAGATGYHGGLVAIKPNTTNIPLVIEGCVFDGKIVGNPSSSTTDCSGFVGFSSYSSLTIINSVYDPADLVAGEKPVYDGYTFAYLGNDPHFTLTNSYYTQVCPHKQGKHARTITSSGSATMALRQTQGLPLSTVPSCVLAKVISCPSSSSRATAPNSTSRKTIRTMPWSMPRTKAKCL